jgi:hypothetical protein
MTSDLNTDNSWSFITIRFHETDIEMFDHFVKYIFIPYIKTNQQYIIGIEFPDSNERHLHAVLKNTTSKDNSKVRQKIHNMCLGKKNKLSNTILVNAIDVKPLPSILDIYTTIGYVAKQSTSDIQTNLPSETIDAGRTALYHETKAPLCEVKHNLKYKTLSKGNVLLHLYNNAIEHPDVPLRSLPSFMVAYKNYSFYPLKLKQVMLELKCKLNPAKYEQIDMIDEFDYDETDLITKENHDLQNKEIIKQLLQENEILKFQNSIMQDEIQRLENKLKPLI